MAAPEILVINVCRIGDTLLATPAVRAIAAAFPEGRITCLAHPKRAEILLNLPFIQHVGGITKGRARLLGRFGRRRFDTAFVYGHDRPLVEYALRVADRVVAFRQGDAGLDARLHKAVAPPAFHSVHAVDHLLALPEVLGIRPDGRSLSYRVTDNENAWARRLLAERLPATASPLIGLQVASFPTKAYRDWPLDHFIGLCERIVSVWPQAHFLILGGKLEKSRTAALQCRFPRNATLFAGTLSLRESAAIMNQLDLYVGVDTGPTHIMGALHRPMVALYHCYSPGRLLAPLEHPCLEVVDHPRADSRCSPETPMAEIEVETVWRSVQAALATKPEH